MGKDRAVIAESPSREYQDVGFPLERRSDNQLNHDEIDLFELLLVIWKGRLKVAIVVAFFVILGLAYVYTATQWFETNFKVSLVKKGALFEVNNSELVKMSPGAALQAIRRKLLSAENFNDFYNKEPDAQTFLPLPEGVEADRYSYAVFKNQISEVEIKAKKEELGNPRTLFQLKLSYPEAVEGDKLLLAYLAWTEQVIKLELASSFEEARDNELLLNQRSMQKALYEYLKDAEITEALALEDYKFKRLVLRDQLEALKSQLIKKNQQRIIVLSENISIARRLGFKKPTTPANEKEVKSVAQASASGVEIVNSEGDGLDKLPLYYRGFESLEAEKTELQNRTKDNFPSAALADIEHKIALLENDRELERIKTRQQPQAFIKNYVALEKRNAHLSVLSLDESKVVLFELDSKPMVSSVPVKPKRVLIVALSLIVGLMMGVLLVLIISARNNRKVTP